MTKTTTTQNEASRLRRLRRRAQQRGLIIHKGRRHGDHHPVAYWVSDTRGTLVSPPDGFDDLDTLDRFIEHSLFIERALPIRPGRARARRDDPPPAVAPSKAAVGAQHLGEAFPSLGLQAG